MGMEGVEPMKDMLIAGRLDTAQRMDVLSRDLETSVARFRLV